MQFFKKFKEFAFKGNVIDLVVGVVIGAAFGKIVASLVNDLIMPPIGILIGGVNFKDLKFKIQTPAVDVTGNRVDAVFINYGNFLQTGLEFLIIAFAVFMLVHLIHKIRIRHESQTTAPVAPSTQEKLLMEIRDLLKKQNG